MDLTETFRISLSEVRIDYSCIYWLPIPFAALCKTEFVEITTALVTNFTRISVYKRHNFGSAHDMYTADSPCTRPVFHVLP